MTNVRDALCQGWFNAVSMTAMVVCCLVCFVAHALPRCAYGLSSSDDDAVLLAAREGACNAACFYLFETPILLCPWIKVASVDAAAERAEWAKLHETLKTRPVFILANHTSFFDVLLFSVRCPVATLKKTRTLAKRGLFTAPIIGYINRSIGHFPVHFSGAKVGDFSVDKSAMGDVMAKVDAHVKGERCEGFGNGCLAFFPEGQINRVDPRTLQSFRRGMFRSAVQKDVAVWAWLVDGNPRTWPPEAAGGLPATVTHTLAPIAPDGVLALAVAKGVAVEPQALAELTQSLMQDELAKLLARVDAAAPSAASSKAKGE
jgi:1-acyl-sn-glycerol-3-phosphate acyltransferase